MTDVAAGGPRSGVRRLTHPAVPAGLVAVAAAAVAALSAATGRVGVLPWWLLLGLAAGYAISGSV